MEPTDPLSPVANGEWQPSPRPEDSEDPEERIDKIPATENITPEDVWDGASIRWSPYTGWAKDRDPAVLQRRARQRSAQVPAGPGGPDGVAACIEMTKLVKISALEARRISLALHELAHLQNAYEAAQVEIHGMRDLLAPVRKERNEVLYDLMRTYGFSAAWLARHVGLSERTVRNDTIALGNARKEDVIALSREAGRRPDLTRGKEAIARLALIPIITKALAAVSQQSELAAHCAELRHERDKLLYRLIDAGVSPRLLGALTGLTLAAVNEAAHKLSNDDPESFPRLILTGGRRQAPTDQDVRRAVQRWADEADDPLEIDRIRQRTAELRRDFPAQPTPDGPTNDGSYTRTAQDDDDDDDDDDDERYIPMSERSYDDPVVQAQISREEQFRKEMSKTNAITAAHWQWREGHTLDVMPDPKGLAMPEASGDTPEPTLPPNDGPAPQRARWVTYMAEPEVTYWSGDTPEPTLPPWPNPR